ncbi:hypothetical protein [Rubripirellula lacrimiformis]|nr:hypothetical protein [Rubripirellula lacrimiformis]
MTNSQRLSTVRECFLRWIGEQGSGEQGSGDGADEADCISAEIIEESFLIREEFFCGRRFRTQSHNAIWFIEQDELKIYHNRDGVVCVLKSDEIDQFLRRPAPVVAVDDHADHVHEDAEVPAILSMADHAAANRANAITASEDEAPSVDSDRDSADDQSGGEIRRAA